MSKKFYAALIVILLALSLAVIVAVGDHFSASYDFRMFPYLQSDEGYEGYAEDPSIVELTDIRAEDGCCKFELHALKRGKTFVYIQSKTTGQSLMESAYVHRFGIITVGSYMGNCTGGIVVPVAILLVLVLFFVDRIRKYRIEIRENFYSYRNVMNLGFIVFLAFLIIYLGYQCFDFRGVDDTIRNAMSSAEMFAHVALPVAFVVSIMISISNINLMRKEGVNWRNMLGFILGAGLCIMTMLPEQVYTFILRTQIVDIFNEKGLGTYLYAALEGTVFAIVTYLECILIGTIVFGTRAARRIPAFDKDYIMILGCQIRDDGTLTPLLKSRTDRAVEFSEMQKKATGKIIKFVPSGGQGSDEVIPEAAAIANYLRSEGVPDEQILTEDKSLNTYENIRNSFGLIDEDFADKAAIPAGEGSEPAGAADKAAEPKVAFSTTNYHVFRAGCLASEQGFTVEGIGSPTKRYFWVNAFIREFIATLVSERRRHLKVVVTLLIGILCLSLMRYFGMQY